MVSLPLTAIRPQTRPSAPTHATNQQPVNAERDVREQRLVDDRNNGLSSVLASAERKRRRSAWRSR
jgi:hypothetical protein